DPTLTRKELPVVKGEVVQDLGSRDFAPDQAGNTINCPLVVAQASSSPLSKQHALAAAIHELHRRITGAKDSASKQTARTRDGLLAVIGANVLIETPTLSGQFVGVGAVDHMVQSLIHAL